MTTARARDTQNEHVKCSFCVSRAFWEHRALMEVVSGVGGCARWKDPQDGDGARGRMIARAQEPHNEHRVLVMWFLRFGCIWGHSVPVDMTGALRQTAVGTKR
jgi:hypothetical protein